MTVRIQPDAFDINAEYLEFTENNREMGGVVMFVGRVRDMIDASVEALTLEHYPAMTERILDDLVKDAKARWNIDQARIVHRVGRLSLGEDIVLVIVGARHRQSAFEACAYLMDILKTDAPFWKQEHTSHGSYWVRERESDQHAKDRWRNA
ncbi:molybdenum cofactor biosynthesis protein MoaE [Larsenimonas suaedae]|uniref:Molybdopterin synthase catalytic subunit n=1 Tax=Larsenimonas suaedae TaxID=1851019 RepID=A0ABU1GZ58_9GAMM|nr:molybdenum cofactor biosynthesis protein MoaE [Larsenimonas suaedae]MCM2971566.1 molybdenum cofactor biosynthesis protein MoaE [Larsenimonas suaedae]MDR5896822.1 molybdenum cofactor biosynthesis protein MoaE [Larsenimonas suaedae]